VLIFKALHILLMFTAVTLLVGEELFIALAIWRRDVTGLATIHRLSGRRILTYAGAGIFLAGVVFGLLTVATGGLDFLAGWLIAAYVQVLAILLLNGSPLVQKGLMSLVEEAVEAEAGQRPVGEVVRHMASSPGAIVVAANVVLIAAIILDMVLKPF